MAEHDLHTIGTATFEEISMLPRNILLRNQNVAVGDVRFTNKLHSNLYLDCIQAGITGAAFPAISAANVEGDVITDGTAQFIVRGVNPSFFRYRQPLTAYAVGDIVYSTKLPSYLRLECVSAGTTGSAEPDYASVSTGGTVVDGTATFILDDIRDGTPVGQVRASMFVPAGYVKLEGATVDRSNYPRLVRLADTYSLWTDDAAANPGLFGEGNGSTTMVLPNWTGRMAQFAATAGGAVAAGLPNVTGEINGNSAIATLSGIDPSATFVGALYADDFTGVVYGGSVTVSNRARNIAFDASLSNPIYSASTTVQPPAINTFAIMRY